MAELWVPFLTGVSVILALLSLYYSYHLYKRYGKLSSGWLFIALAMAMVVVHRAIVFLIDFNAYPINDSTFISLKNIASFAFFLIMVFVLYGLWKLKGMFDEYELVEREILGRIRKLDSGKKRK